jgi:hypothetical protein
MIPFFITKNYLARLKIKIMGFKNEEIEIMNMEE